MTAIQDRIERAFALFEGLLEADRELSGEFAASAGEFFSAGLPRREPELARRRHLEWFLLERGADAGDGPAFERLGERHPGAIAALEHGERQAFLGSHASVFEVTGVQPGNGIWLRDLASLGEYPMHEPEASHLLQPGDMIVGRIFPVGDGLHHASRAAAFFRDETLLAALRRDLERARDGRRTVLRIAQSEIEAMFFAPTPEETPEEERESAVPAARRLLLEGGMERADVEAVLEDLAQSPYDAENPVPGAGDALGAALDRLAFETSVDLDEARRVLIAAWAELARRGPGEGASLEPQPGAGRAAVDVARSLAEFDRKRSAGAPLEQSLRELERDLALEGALEADEDEALAPDFPGVVGAMVEEFLWELSREGGEGAVRGLESLRAFARFAEPLGVFENLGTRDLLAYTCHWLPESGELANAAEGQQAVDALQRFCRWAEEQQDLPLHSAFRGEFQSIAATLPRIVEANRRRTRSADPAQGELYEVLAIAPDGAARLRDRRGNESEASTDPLIAAWLREGDLLRARRLDDGRLAVYCAYPPQARALGPTSAR